MASLFPTRDSHHGVKDPDSRAIMSYTGGGIDSKDFDLPA